MRVRWELLARDPPLTANTGDALLTLQGLQGVNSSSRLLELLKGVL